MAAVSARAHTSGKHALNKIVDVAEDDPEALRIALLARKRLDLDTLKAWLRGIRTRIRIRVEDGPAGID